ncbi:EAL domain-containing protein [Qipengyuania sp. JC766]|uniref:EAL domain-containing protein n=1 Tax=Qipengyuania sp. JC766 TaxID=3232139 RepID=UPI0034580062
MSYALLMADPIIDRRSRTDRRNPAVQGLGSALRRAIENDSIDILFQAQFACADDTIAGAEALVRWPFGGHHPVSGDTLFEIARQTDLAEVLASYVYRKAMTAALNWPEDLRLSLNVTAHDLADTAFAKALFEDLEATGFPADRLTLEITEQALVPELDRAAVLLRVLADEGIAVALDDFGAGFCNFRYLKVLPLDALKLDRSMVQGIVDEPTDLAVLQGIVAMAEALELKVIAEGVETDAQRDAVRRERCDRWQGFLGAKPMSADAFDSLLKG